MTLCEVRKNLRAGYSSLCWKKAFESGGIPGQGFEEQRTKADKAGKGVRAEGMR